MLKPIHGWCPLCAGNGCSLCDESGEDDGGPDFFEREVEDDEEDL